MNYIPPLTPFNFTKAEVIDYKTVFPNSENTQGEKHPLTPEWRQVIPSNTEIKFAVWSDAMPIVTINGADGDETITATSVSTLYTVAVQYTGIGDSFITIDIDGTEYTSNTFTVLDELVDDNTEYAYLEFSHFKNDFDYWFIDGTTTNYYGVWIEKMNNTPTVSTDIGYYEGDNNKSIVTNSTVNNGEEFTVPAVDLWFSKLLNSVVACSDLRLNGIEYVSNGATAAESVEEGVNAYNVTISLTEK